VLDIGAKRFVVIGKPLRLHVDGKTEMRHPFDARAQRDGPCRRLKANGKDR
jgi:hypothetical protein